MTNRKYWAIIWIAMFALLMYVGATSNPQNIQHQPPKPTTQIVRDK